MAPFNWARATRLAQTRHFSQLVATRTRLTRASLDKRKFHPVATPIGISATIRKQSFGFSNTFQEPAATGEAVTRGPSTGEPANEVPVESVALSDSIQELAATLEQAVEKPLVEGASTGEPAKGESRESIAPQDPTEPHTQTGQDISPEASVWLSAAPLLETKWEISLKNLHGPRFRNKLSDLDRKLLRELEKRRDIISTKLKFLVGKTKLRHLLKIRHINRARWTSASNPNNFQYSSGPPIALLLGDQGVELRAQGFIKLLEIVQEVRAGHAQAVRLLRHEFNRQLPYLTTSKGRVKKASDNKTVEFLARLRKKIAAIHVSERTSESMVAALSGVQQELLAEYNEPMTEEEIEDFVFRNEKQRAAEEDWNMAESRPLQLEKSEGKTQKLIYLE